MTLATTIRIQAQRPRAQAEWLARKNADLLKGARAFGVADATLQGASVDVTFEEWVDEDVAEATLELLNDAGFLFDAVEIEVADESDAATVVEFLRTNIECAPDDLLVLTPGYGDDGLEMVILCRSAQVLDVIDAWAEVNRAGDYQ